MPYDQNSEYSKYQVSTTEEGDSDCCSESSDCGCCPTGTVAVYNEDGTHSGCLTLNDAEIFNSSMIEPIEGYVKTFHPTTGAYLGSMSVSDSIDLLNYLSNAVLPVTENNSFNIVAPVILPSGFVDITYPLVDAITADTELTIDRLGSTDSVILSIIDSEEDIQFEAGGTTDIIPTGNSTKTVKFKWAGIAVIGTYNFTLNFTANGVSKDVVFRLTLT